MSDPIFNKDLCTGCGTCVAECNLIGIENLGRGNFPKMKISNLCIACGHCVAVCPNDAVTHPYFEMSNCHRIGEIAQPGALAELFKVRRSAREFKNKPIEKAVVEDIINMASYAPSDLNSQNRYFYVLTAPEKINFLEAAIVEGFAKYIESAPQLGLLETSPQILLSRDIVNDFQNGKHSIFRNAPCLIFIYGPNEMESHFAYFNAITANAFMMLYARSLGLESCVIGRAMYDPNSLTNFLEIQQNYKIYSVLALGYPKAKYRKTVDRKPKKVIWN